jgi:hypothetical protein
MKNLKLLSLLFVATLIFTGCSDSDDPAPINEEEVITTLIAELTAPGGTVITLTSTDADGDGPNAPVINVSGALAANTTYTGVMQVLNELETPAEDITIEVAEEDDEHQFFFSSSLVSTAYTDQDGNGNPVGINFTLTTTAAGTGSITITLIHEPVKPNDGTVANAGGETDVEATFPITVQ